jgi:hypothetical protein
MSDYSESGAIPVEDAAVEHPPTIDDVIQQQRREYPEQAATSTRQPIADVLEAFNAEEVVTAPGEPPAPVVSPANDTDVPPPG